MQNSLTDIEARKVKNIIRRMAKVLTFAFAGKTDIYIGFYALMTSELLVDRYFKEDCSSIEEFKQVRRCLLKNLSDFQKALFALEFKKGGKSE